MKPLNFFLLLLATFTIVSCYDEILNFERSNSGQKLIQIAYNSLDKQEHFIRDYFYDDYGEISEIKNDDGLLIEKFTYNSMDKVIKDVFFQYSEFSKNKETTIISYDKNGKISNLFTSYIIYNLNDSIMTENFTNHKIIYTPNSITRVSDDFMNTKVEFSLNNDLITRIKVHRNGKLDNDMTLTYDTNENCISGIGTFKNYYYDTIDDIEFSVIYGTEEKVPILNSFFDYKILTCSTFESFREVLINGRGNRYPEKIQWYRNKVDEYHETYDYLFDDQGNLETKIINDEPDYMNYGIYTYTWE